VPSPHEIETKQFLTVMRGFDPDEVGAFLREVADQVRALLQAVYALLPPEGTPSAEAMPELDDLLAHGEKVSAEVARLAATGRAAQLDAAAVLRMAEVQSRTLQQSAAEQRLAAVREAAGLLRRAKEEAETLRAEAEQRQRDAVRRLRDVDLQLAETERVLAGVRTDLRSTGAQLLSSVSPTPPLPAAALPTADDVALAPESRS
jgi:DivIVA domain-containing protein